jgi:hypothetical protein
VPLNPAYKAGLAGHVPAKDFGPVMNHPSLTGGIAIQPVCRIPPISGGKRA